MSIDGLDFVACANASFIRVHSSTYTTYYGLHLQSVQMAEIIDSTFQDSYGSALGVVNSHVVLSGNRFFNNCRLCLNGMCDNQLSICFGGGVFVQRSNLNITGSSSFFVNSAWYGGGVSAQYSSNVDISGNTTFSGNSASYGGGVSAWDSSNVDITGNTTFIGNSARSDGGGGAWHRSNVYISGNTTFSGNSASYGSGGGVSTVYSSNVYISGKTTFSGNSASYGSGGGVSTLYSSNVYISGNTNFSGNSARNHGGGVSAISSSNVDISGNTIFSGNSASYGDGGALGVLCSNVYISGNAMFRSNSARIGGGVLVQNHCPYSATSLNLDGNVSFTNCSATNDGGAIHASGIQVNVSGTNVFNSNRATHFGGGLYSHKSFLNIDGDNTFTANWAGSRGGGIYSQETNISFSGTGLFSGNKVQLDGGGIYADGSNLNFTGGGISAFQSSFQLGGQNTFESNKAAEGGGLYTFNCTVNFPGENTFITNSASYQGGGSSVVHGTLNMNGSTTFKNNSATSGGGMYIDGSKACIDGNSCFMNNTAESGGGAIYARDSVAEFSGKDGSAERKDAAIHASFSTLILQESSSFVNNSAKYGGGIYSESSNLTLVHDRSSYLKNMALRGGAQYFDVNSNFTLHQTARVHFQGNNATEFGGAIYAVDEPSRSECFFHIQNVQFLDLNTTPLVFENNSAQVRGSVLYGGLLDKCSFASDKYTSVLQLFNMSIVKGSGDKGHSISSDPTQLCFCNRSKVNCREKTQSRSIYPGQQVEVSVVAIDQSVSEISALIHTAVRSGQILNMSEIISYETGENCNSRNYSVIPKNLFNQLEFYPSNKSGDIMHLIVNITFTMCPIGFEKSNFTGTCICDHRLWQYTNSCKIDRQAIFRNSSSTFWLQGVSYNNGTPEGFIHHPYCPLDYCTSESEYINLNNPDGQCSLNRSGLLCGKCKEGLSIVLGSSQCKTCSNNYLALLIPFALAGVLLVILLFLLNLTVTAGTLHGLIFYANIVEANYYIFLPQSSSHPTTIFIAWLNLDLGIQTCFYNGMDAYAKTWLDLVFPVYIWVIVGFLVYISHRSVVVTKLLGSSPVPVLATLFLLSYAKVLRTIIAALSLTVLHYPHKNVLVWIHDANVSLAKYIPLALIAMFFLVFLFLPYTLLLLLDQWIRTKSHLCLLSWVRNPKLKAILDTYHAPYKPKHRYWTGILLLVRCALFLVFAFNISGNDSVNLLVVSSTAFGIFIWFALSGMVYKCWCLNVVELSFILNLGILAVTTYHVKLSGGSQAAVAYTSVGIAFLTFVGIVTYHIYMRIKSKVQYIQRGYQLLHRNGNCHGRCEENGANLEHQCEVTPNIVTHTEVNLRELRSPLDLIDTK